MKSIEDVLALIRPLDEVWLERARSSWTPLQRERAVWEGLRGSPPQIVSSQGEGSEAQSHEESYIHLCLRPRGYRGEGLGLSKGGNLADGAQLFRGGAGINALARTRAPDVVVVDMGVGP